jgi:hypothetical protein
LESHESVAQPLVSEREERGQHHARRRATHASKKLGRLRLNLVAKEATPQQVYEEDDLGNPKHYSSTYEDPRLRFKMWSKFLLPVGRR